MYNGILTRMNQFAKLVVDWATENKENVLVVNIGPELNEDLTATVEWINAVGMDVTEQLRIKFIDLNRKAVILRKSVTWSIFHPCYNELLIRDQHVYNIGDKYSCDKGKDKFDFKYTLVFSLPSKELIDDWYVEMKCRNRVQEFAEHAGFNVTDASASIKDDTVEVRLKVEGVTCVEAGRLKKLFDDWHSIRWLDRFESKVLTRKCEVLYE